MGPFPRARSLDLAKERVADLADDAIMIEMLAGVTIDAATFCWARLAEPNASY
jgi:hypothetical protein